MKDYGLVSVITASYNCSKFIGATIESVLNQTYQNWELLITDDCSTDDSREVIKSYADKDPRIKLFVLEKNSGAGIARNNSIKEAKGRFIAFCDSDDRWYPDKLEKQLAFMTENDVSISYTSYMTCDEEGKVDGIVVAPHRASLQSTLKDDKMGCLTVVYDTEKVGKVFMPIVRKRQDWGLKLNVLKICKEAKGMKEPLAIYRICTSSLSRNKRSLIKHNIAIYKEVMGWNPLKANLYFYGLFLPNYFAKRLFIYLINR